MTTSTLCHPDGTWDSRLADWRGVGAFGGTIPDRPATLYFPEGVRTFTEQLVLKSGDVLKGAGIGKTILEFPQPLNVMVGAGTDGKDPSHGQSWGFGVLQAIGQSEIGIEDLTIRFTTTEPYPGHFLEKGYNGISFRGCSDCWVRNVEIVNMDSGIFFEETSHHLTAQGITLRTSRAPANDPAYGWVRYHHGIEVQRATDCLVRDYTTTARGIHDIGVENAARCALSHLKGTDLVLDHHNCALGNQVILWDDVDLGLATRVFQSGGNVKPGYQHGGPGNVYWNLRRGDGSPYTTPPSQWSPAGIIECLPNQSPRSLYAFERGDEPLGAPAMPKFVVNDTVRATSQVNVRQAAGTDQPLVGTQPTGASGFILAGPIAATGYTYWKVDFNTGVDGWVGEDRLEKVAPVPPPLPPPPLTVRQQAEAKLVALGLTAEEAATL